MVEIEDLQEDTEIIDTGHQVWIEIMILQEELKKITKEMKIHHHLIEM